MKQSILALFALFVSFNLFGQQRDPIDDGRRIRIPVVFHVLYKDSEENISDDLIETELHDLNLDLTARNDMSLLEAEFRPLVGNPNIEFYLLDTLFQGSSMKGVRRVSSKEVKQRSALLINSQLCLNVFIADQGNASGILIDRVNLYYGDVGKRTHVLTHETGHWLGLYHTFGQIGNSSRWNVAFGNHDDLIDDTPRQNKATAKCYSITAKCPCPPINIFYKKHKVLYNNFMDYNPCRCMFTVGQSIKIRNNIIKEKRALFQ